MMSKSNRFSQISDLKIFCFDFQNSLNDVFNRLNWEQKKVEESESMVWCPLDTNHLVSNKSIDKHLKRCQMKAKGLINEEMDVSVTESLPDSNAFYYESCPNVKPLVIDKQIEQKILAFGLIFFRVLQNKWNCLRIDINYMTIFAQSLRIRVFGQPMDAGFSSDRSLHIELSTEQRLALYNHVIQTTREENNISKLKDQSFHSISVDLFDEINKKSVQSVQQTDVSSRVNIISKMRDSKRRRPSFRSKSEVHTRGRTYTEVIREVIENHCKTLEENFKSNEISCETHKHKIDYKSEHKHKRQRHQSQDRYKPHKRHRHHKH